MKKNLAILLAVRMVCGTAFAAEPSGNGGRAAFVESLVGPTSVFLDCGQSDAWETVNLLKHRYGLSDADVSSAMVEVLEKTVGETNATRGSIRAGAAMMLGKYGTADNLPLLRGVALAKDDPAAPTAFQSFQTLASLDNILELVEDTYSNPDCKSYRRMRGMFFWQTEKKAKKGSISDSDRLKLCRFMKKRASSEPDVRDVLEIDGVLSLLDKGYAESRERMINIEKALKSGRPVDSFTMSNALKRLEAAKDLVLAADRKNAAASGGAGREHDK